MSYPNIYALSTVGILKHYNQDYLINPVRTDFTGSNGVGKSIIADLLQLIFVTDRSLFEFGTEGLRKEARQINKLPHLCRDAYAFLTIEMAKGQFISIGVCIPNSSNRPLKSFVVLNDLDENKPLLQRTFNGDRLLTHKSFITENNRIPVIEDAARHLRDKHGLYLKYYTTKEQKLQYYSFLFNNYILPINLSIETNLKAFAKIVQSFSKARVAGENTSAGLKEFLFDGNEKEFEGTFAAHKVDIEKLLKDFHELQKFIADLEAKQSRLLELKQQETTYVEAHKKHLIGNTVSALSELNKAKHIYNQKIKELDETVGKTALLADRAPRLESVCKSLSLRISETEESVQTAQDIIEQFKAYGALETQWNSLVHSDAAVIDEVLEGQINMDDFDVKEIVRRIKEFKPLYEAYGSLQAMEMKVAAQKLLIHDRKVQIKAELQHFNLLSDLISNTKTGSLLSRVLQSEISISAAQEAVIFHLLDTHWQKPELLDTFHYYADGFAFLDEKNIVEDAALDGYWLRLDDLNQFIPKLKAEPMLADSKIRAQAISLKKEQNEIGIAVLELEAKQLDLFEQGKPFQPDTSTLFAQMDAGLYDHSVVNYLKITALIIRELDQTISDLKTKMNVAESQLADLKAKVNFTVSEENIAEILKLRQTNLAVWQKRNTDVNNCYLKEQGIRSTLSTSTIPLLTNQVEEKKTIFNRNSITYYEELGKLEKAFPDENHDTQQHFSEEDIARLNQLHIQSKLGFFTSYKSICESFKETALQANAEVAEQIQDEKYNFLILESVLLGKIRHVDQIADELTTANASRFNLIESIHETMLKIFMQTKDKYDEYRTLIRDLNIFFKGKKISNKYFFQIAFTASAEFPIDWINELQSHSQRIYKPGELPLGDSVEVFIEDFFKKAVGYQKRMQFSDLLDPKTYFDLSVSLTDENHKEIPGSTGETYSAKVLLGIGRLSKVQAHNRDGIRFIILEETANLDKTNFNNFPAIAEEFGYQIITMTPKPFGSDSAHGWYLHHLLAGNDDPDINYPVPSSYFKTNTGKEELNIYLESLKG